MIELKNVATNDCCRLKRCEGRHETIIYSFVHNVLSAFKGLYFCIAHYLNLLDLWGLLQHKNEKLSNSSFCVKYTNFGYKYERLKVMGKKME